MNTDVLTGEPREELQQVEGPDDQAQTGQVDEGQSGTTTQDTTEKHVPLSALEAVRGERKDWKEKALRLEGEVNAYRQRQAQEQPQGEQVERNPLQVMHEQMINERFNISEMLVRQKYQDTDEKIAVFKEALDKNPALYAQMQAQQNPWEFAYKEGARMLLQKEMGDDPTAYKSKLEAEIEARILAKHGLSQEGQSTQTAAPLKLPTSLAGARSSAARSAPAYTGPTPFDQILK